MTVRLTMPDSTPATARAASSCLGSLHASGASSYHGRLVLHDTVYRVGTDIPVQWSASTDHTGMHNIDTGHRGGQTAPYAPLHPLSLVAGGLTVHPVANMASTSKALGCNKLGARVPIHTDELAGVI